MDATGNSNNSYAYNQPTVLSQFFPRKRNVVVVHSFSGNEQTATLSAKRVAKYKCPLVVIFRRVDAK